MKPYIYQKTEWPNFTWDSEKLLFILGRVRYMQGKLIGKMESLGSELKNEAVLQTLSLDVLKSTEIDGEILNPDQVRSSIARRLGMNIPGLITSEGKVDGMVEMMLDATDQYNNQLTKNKLFDWHRALFPTGHSGLYKINAGHWRTDVVEVITGALGKEKIHFQAPDAFRIDQEISLFLDWLNNNDKIEPVLKAGLAHLWFVTIHPFDAGNGKITRAITEMLLARSDGSSQRFYSLSAQIRIERKHYYEILEKTQTGGLDVTEWLDWFLNCLMDALITTDKTLAKVLFKSQFWQKHSKSLTNSRQQLLLNKLLDGFDGKFTSSKWAKIAKCSADTALRDIQDLMNKDILRKEFAGGRSTNYELNDTDMQT